MTIDSRIIAEFFCGFIGEENSIAARKQLVLSKIKKSVSNTHVPEDLTGVYQQTEEVRGVGNKRFKM